MRLCNEKFLFFLKVGLYAECNEYKKGLWIDIIESPLNEQEGFEFKNDHNRGFAHRIGALKCGVIIFGAF